MVEYVIKGRTHYAEPRVQFSSELSDDIKSAVRKNAVRHAGKLVDKLEEILTLPKVAVDAIRKEIEYAALDGYRVTKRILEEK